MALITCPECKKRISDSANHCPKCGYELKPSKIVELIGKEKQNQKRGAIGCLSIIAIIVLVAVFAPSTPESAEKRMKYSAQAGVEVYLKSNLKDPGSLDFIEWSPVVKEENGKFSIRAKYRAKNSFGGYVVNNMIFQMDSTGSVEQVSEFWAP